MDVMFNGELQGLEGVWTGTEHVSEGDNHYDASGRLVFQTVFDGRFLLCDYVRTAPERPTAFAHGVFRRDDQSNALTVTWFRSSAATATHQADAVAEGDKLIFFETLDARMTRTSYSVLMDRLSVYTERETGADWLRVFEGTYRRR
jgi:hypothetical protein